MNRIFYILSLTLSLSCMVATLFFSFPAGAQATGIYFGGWDVMQVQCNSGYLITFKSAEPAFKPSKIMWNWGELPFLAYVPPHPGQSMIGFLAPVPEPCFLGKVKIGEGLPIEFHGENI